MIMAGSKISKTEYKLTANNVIWMPSQLIWPVALQLDSSVYRSLQWCWMLTMQLVDVLPGGAHKKIHVDTFLTALTSDVFICCSIPIFLSSLIRMAAGDSFSADCLAGWIYVFYQWKSCFCGQIVTPPIWLAFGVEYLSRDGCQLVWDNRMSILATTAYDQIIFMMADPSITNDLGRENSICWFGRDIGWMDWRTDGRHMPYHNTTDFRRPYKNTPLNWYSANTLIKGNHR